MPRRVRLAVAWVTSDLKLWCRVLSSPKTRTR